MRPLSRVSRFEVLDGMYCSSWPDMKLFGYLCGMKSAIKRKYEQICNGLKRFKCFKRSKKKKVKPIKKNTWKRKLRAWDLRTDRRQQQRTTIAIEADSTARVCSNCGESYTGRLCPQCGQPGTWTRYTWKQMFINVLDIWGLGNRPMFRTLKELFWRPGYMVRDYLNGHRQFYFPPFKLLAVSVILLLFFNFVVTSFLTSVCGNAVDLTELKQTSLFGPFADDIGRHHFEGGISVFTDALHWLLKFLSKNLLYEYLFFAGIMAPFVWLAFRRVARYNFVETYIFIIFVLCQQLLVNIPQIMGMGLGRIVDFMSLGTAQAYGAVHPAAITGALSFVFNLLAGPVSAAFTFLIIYWLILAFRQFYGLNWRSTIGHIILSVLILIVFAVIIGLVFGIFINPSAVDKQWLIMFVVLMILSMVAFLFALDYLGKNKEQVPGIVANVCKVSVLSIFVAIPMSIGLLKVNYTLMSVMSMTLVYAVLVFVLSLSPVVLYKKYHRIWLACTPLLLVPLAIYLQTLLYWH